MRMRLAAACGVMPARPRVWYVLRLSTSLPPIVRNNLH